ncbi:MAG TPA: molybdopterin-dependent oxidoreductase [Geminicoccaceae bacterium]|nr:molybdopterin-dependent oxidoreductase [Geminicoccus sp.]HMU48454.1 molybdopterin-dependent oxidoreductase [Geminicoccaceae bacterium]
MQRPTRRGFLAFGIGVAGMPCGRTASAAVPEPRSEVILTVEGAIGDGRSAGPVRFDIDALRGLGVYTLRSRTPFTEGESDFEGVLGRNVMAAVQAHGSQATAYARNDYSAEIPLSDFADWDVLLVTHMDGRRLRLRDKGPLWIVYPWSQHPELDNRVTRQKSVWQLYRFSVS